MFFRNVSCFFNGLHSVISQTIQLFDISSPANYPQDVITEERLFYGGIEECLCVSAVSRVRSGVLLVQVLLHEIPNELYFILLPIHHKFLSALGRNKT
jgi:hypothetical protein